MPNKAGNLPSSPEKNQFQVSSDSENEEVFKNIILQAASLDIIDARRTNLFVPNIAKACFQIVVKNNTILILNAKKKPITTLNPRSILKQLCEAQACHTGIDPQVVLKSQPWYDLLTIEQKQQRNKLTLHDLAEICSVSLDTVKGQYRNLDLADPKQKSPNTLSHDSRKPLSAPPSATSIATMHEPSGASEGGEKRFEGEQKSNLPNAPANSKSLNDENLSFSRKKNERSQMQAQTDAPKRKRENYSKQDKGSSSKYGKESFLKHERESLSKLEKITSPQNQNSNALIRKITKSSNHERSSSPKENVKEQTKNEDITILVEDDLSQSIEVQKKVSSLKTPSKKEESMSVKDESQLEKLSLQKNLEKKNYKVEMKTSTKNKDFREKKRLKKQEEVEHSEHDSDSIAFAKDHPVAFKYMGLLEKIEYRDYYDIVFFPPGTNEILLRGKPIVDVKEVDFIRVLYETCRYYIPRKQKSIDWSHLLVVSEIIFAFCVEDQSAEVTRKIKYRLYKWKSKDGHSFTSTLVDFFNFVLDVQSRVDASPDGIAVEIFINMLNTLMEFLIFEQAMRERIDKGNASQNRDSESLAMSEMYFGPLLKDSEVMESLLRKSLELQKPMKEEPYKRARTDLVEFLLVIWNHKIFDFQLKSKIARIIASHPRGAFCILKEIMTFVQDEKGDDCNRVIPLFHFLLKNVRILGTSLEKLPSVNAEDVLENVGSSLMLAFVKLVRLVEKGRMQEAHIINLSLVIEQLEKRLVRAVALNSRQCKDFFPSLMKLITQACITTPGDEESNERDSFDDEDSAGDENYKCPSQVKYLDLTITVPSLAFRTIAVFGFFPELSSFVKILIDSHLRGKRIFDKFLEQLSQIQGSVNPDNLPRQKRNYRNGFMYVYTKLCIAYRDQILTSNNGLSEKIPYILLMGDVMMIPDHSQNNPEDDSNGGIFTMPTVEDLKIGASKVPFSLTGVDSIVEMEKLLAILDGLKRITGLGDSPPSFERIFKNSYTVKRDSKDDEEETKCGCVEVPGKIACLDENCSNYKLNIECNPQLCNGGRSCENQRFQNKKWSKFKVTKAPGTKGFGLFAEKRIPAHTFVAEYLGEVIDRDEFLKRKADRVNEKNFYFMSLGKLFIDASRKGNDIRYANHSCDPNCATQKWKVKGQDRIGIFSITDIEEGEEITFDYRADGESRDGERSVRCECNTEKCRGWVIGGPEEDTSDNEGKSREDVQFKKKQRKAVLDLVESFYVLVRSQPHLKEDRNYAELQKIVKESRNIFDISTEEVKKRVRERELATPAKLSLKRIEKSPNESQSPEVSPKLRVKGTSKNAPEESPKFFIKSMPKSGRSPLKVTSSFTSKSTPKSSPKPQVLSMDANRFEKRLQMMNMTTPGQKNEEINMYVQHNLSDSKRQLKEHLNEKKAQKGNASDDEKEKTKEKLKPLAGTDLGNGGSKSLKRRLSEDLFKNERNTAVDILRKKNVGHLLAKSKLDVSESNHVGDDEVSKEHERKRQKSDAENEISKEVPLNRRIKAVKSKIETDESVKSKLGKDNAGSTDIEEGKNLGDQHLSLSVSDKEKDDKKVSDKKPLPLPSRKSRKAESSSHVPEELVLINNGETDDSEIEVWSPLSCPEGLTPIPRHLLNYP